MMNKNNNYKKYKYTKDINVRFNIVDIWKIKFEFIVHNIWLIMSDLLLISLNVLHYLTTNILPILLHKEQKKCFL